MKIDSRQWGVIGTILFHGIVLLILLLFSFSAPTIEYPEPDGIVIDFGELVMGDEGSTDNNEVASQEDVVQNVAKPVEATSVVTQATESNVKQPSIPKVTESDVPKLTEEEQEELKKQEDFKRQQDALMKNFGKGNSTGNGGNSTTGAESGLAGNPNGSGNTGKTKGTPGNRLGNGDAAHLVKPNNTQNCNSPVTLMVIVNSQGNVVKIDRIETALSEQSCIDAAKEAAKKTTFQPDYSQETRYAKIIYDYTTSK